MLNYKGVQKCSKLYWFAILKHLTKKIFIVFLYLLYLPETESQLKKKIEGNFYECIIYKVKKWKKLFLKKKYKYTLK